MLIMLASGQGGAGKTTLTAELARAFSSMGKKVIAIDGCCRARDLDLAFGVQDQVVYDWSDIVTGDCSLAEALVRVDEKVHLLSCPQIAEWQSSYEKPFGNMMKKLREQADVILLDSPAFQLPEAAFFSTIADTILMLSAAEDSPLRKAESALNILSRDCDRYLIVAQSGKKAYSPTVASQVLDIPLLAVSEGDLTRCALQIAGKLSGKESDGKIGFLQRIRERRNRF